MRNRIELNSEIEELQNKEIISDGTVRITILKEKEELEEQLEKLKRRIIHYAIN